MTSLWDSLRGPGMKTLVKVFHNSLWEDLVAILVTSFKRSLCEDLVEILWHPSEILSDAFAWSCTGPCEKPLQRSWRNLLGVLAWSRTGPCGKILWRSCWNPPQEVLALRPWRCFALVLVWKFFWDAPSKLLYEDLLPVVPHKAVAEVSKIGNL